MSRSFHCCALLVGVMALAAASPPALATAQRTFVASDGLDTNPCSIVAPCRSFAAAIAQTSSSGEVIVQNSGGYGSVTVTKSVSIIAPAGVYAGLSVFGANDGITVNGGGISVTLRGLTINGQGGNVGVNFVAGTRLRLEGLLIANMNSHGVSVAAAGSEVVLVDSVVRDNGGVGLLSTGNATLGIDRVRFAGNGDGGLQVTDGSNASISNSQFLRNGGPGIHAIATVATTMAIDATDIVSSDNGAQGILVSANAANSHIHLAVTRASVKGNSDGISAGSAFGTTVASIKDSAITKSATHGVSSSGAGTTLEVTGNTITGQGSGGLVQLAGSTLISIGTNAVHGNAIDKAGTISVVAGD